MAGLLASEEDLARVKVLCEPEPFLIVDPIALKDFSSSLSLQVLDMAAQVFHHFFGLTLHIPRIAFLCNETLRRLSI